MSLEVLEIISEERQECFIKYLCDLNRKPERLQDKSQRRRA
jgi:hypothetical protein